MRASHILTPFGGCTVCPGRVADLTSEALSTPDNTN